MVYIFNKTGELIEKLDNDGDCVTWLRENKHAKGRECEILMRINRSILHKIYYYDLIFSNVININLKDFDSIKDRISKLNIGDIIGGDEYEIIKLGRYKDGASKFIMKCLKCGAEKSTDYKGVVYSTKCNKCSLNEFEISDDKEYWIGFTQNKECFLFSGDDNIIKYIKSHTWRKTTQGYFQNRKGEKIHRVVMGLLDVKYKNWFIDHVDGDGLNNTIENLIITDAKGNGHKIKGCGYYERSDSKGIYRASGVLNGKKYDKTFYTEQEAIDYVSEKRKEFFETRLQFKTKLELDEYLNETYGKNII